MGDAPDTTKQETIKIQMKHECGGELKEFSIGTLWGLHPSGLLIESQENPASSYLYPFSSYAWARLPIRLQKPEEKKIQQLGGPLPPFTLPKDGLGGRGFG